MKALKKRLLLATFGTFPLGLTASPTNAYFIDEGGNQLAELSLEQREVAYICFGSGTRIVQETETKKVFFLQEDVDPKKGLRVEIKNTTPHAFDDKQPYSNREYESASYGSEKIILKVDTRHRTKTFSLSGRIDKRVTNTFSYEIYRKTDGQVIDFGEFEIPVFYSEAPPATIIDDPRYCNDFNPPIPFPR